MSKTTNEIIEKLKTPIPEAADGCGYWRELDEYESFMIGDRLQTLLAENTRLNELINNPQTDDFIEAMKTEAAHQCERWDDSKNTNVDWMWRLAYISSKTVHKEDQSKVKHWIISCAALCLNWFKAIPKAECDHMIELSLDEMFEGASPTKVFATDSVFDHTECPKCKRPIIMIYGMRAIDLRDQS